jgi:hypothetical protein
MLSKYQPPAGMRPEGGAVLSPSGYISRSPFGSGSVLKPSGTRSGMPSKATHGFQPSFRNPNMVEVPVNGSTSTPSASTKSGPISPSIWYGSITLTGVPGASSPSACRSR